MKKKYIIPAMINMAQVPEEMIAASLKVFNDGDAEVVNDINEVLARGNNSVWGTEEDE